MAIPHFSVSILTRAKGKSVVMSAAYRHCARMDYQREARVIDYRAKSGLFHEEFVLPEDAPAWVHSLTTERCVSGVSEAFWNRIEQFETRSDAQLAKDMTIALPVELDPAQNIALIRDFVARYITPQGAVADWVYHEAAGNPHVHLMTCLRPLTVEGFGPKKVAITGPDGLPLRDRHGRYCYRLWAGGPAEFAVLRDGWFACQNRHLAKAGLDVRVDGRSFEQQGIELQPTTHLGVATRAIERKSGRAGEVADLERLDLNDACRRENALRITRQPHHVLELITREKSVFDEHDVAKVLHRYIDDPDLFQNLMARILQDPESLRLDRARIDGATGKILPAKYTTRELIRLESTMVKRSLWLARRSSHRVDPGIRDANVKRHRNLSEEQKAAISHVLGPQQIAAVIGRAGSGKTTMMRCARDAWEAAGYRVVGAALAGKAAEGLENEAGISSRTLSAWQLSWSHGLAKLDQSTVLVMDEAGMVASRQMAEFIETVTRTGAKLVLVGDPDQLQPIEAGAAFRAILERIGYRALETIYRQSEPWMREASLALARGQVARAVSAYQAEGRVAACERKADAISRLIADWDRDHDPRSSSLILAHLRRDVRVLNTLARSRLVERGLIGKGSTFLTADGARSFAPGDQVVFLRNDQGLGVKNGQLGRVREAADGRLSVEVGTPGHMRTVVFDQSRYDNIDLGYATTIHKAQGTTVDRVKVLASLSLDRHLTYVAMTRHRCALDIYYGRQSFRQAGGLIGVLGRENAKETSLDYGDRDLARLALRFAERRGFHLVRVARTLLSDRLGWTLSQPARLVDLGRRLAAIALKGSLTVGRGRLSEAPETHGPALLGAITNHQRSVEDVVAERLGAEPLMVSLWQEVSMRFQQVFATPDLAYRALDLDRMMRDGAWANRMISTIAERPDVLAPLRGKPGLLASRADRALRALAHRHQIPLADSLRDYVVRRHAAEQRYQAEERVQRQRSLISIPSLSVAAIRCLERVKQCSDVPGLELVDMASSLDQDLKVELAVFAKAVADRFGERLFLSPAAKDPGGAVFSRLTADLDADQIRELRGAWTLMRAAQLLSVQTNKQSEAKKSELEQLSPRKGLQLK